jgi:hypothetical protein
MVFVTPREGQRGLVLAYFTLVLEVGAVHGKLIPIESDAENSNERVLYTQYLFIKEGMLYDACRTWLTVYDACRTWLTVYDACRTQPTAQDSCRIWLTVYGAYHKWPTVHDACRIWLTVYDAC